MNYTEAVAYIDDTAKYGSNLGLETIGFLLEKLGNPQDELEYIHIAGTNGKGSTSAYVAEVLEEAGYRVGLFTSPFLERFNERMRINKEDISNDDIARLTVVIKEKVDEMIEEGKKHPTSFEIITALMFMYFAEQKVDYVVLEVGLGGRLDSTNIIKDSLISVITTIDFDHIAELGDTLEKIAYEKAGIIKEDGLVVSYPQDGKVEKVLIDTAKEKNAELYFDEHKDLKIIKESEYGSEFNFSYKDKSFESVKIKMLGKYQVFNASLAMTALLTLREKALVEFTDAELLEGIKNTKWNGRLEVMQRNPTFLIDGAHNRQGADNLKKALEMFEYDRLILGIAILKDKDVDHIVNTLMPLADEIIVTEVDAPRKKPMDELGEIAKEFTDKVYVEADHKKAVDKSLELAKENDMIVFAGSLYLIGEVRTIYNNL